MGMISNKFRRVGTWERYGAVWGRSMRLSNTSRKALLFKIKFWKQIWKSKL